MMKMVSSRFKEGQFFFILTFTTFQLLQTIMAIYLQVTTQNFFFEILYLEETCNFEPYFML